MRRLRILHLIKSLNRGGAETLLTEGLRFADQQRFQLSYGYFNPSASALVPLLVAAGAPVTCFGGDNHLTMLAHIGGVSRYLRAQQVDLLHCHLPTAAVVGRLAAKLANVPVVYTEHNKPEWYRKPTFLLNAWTYGLQERVIAVSESVERSIHTYIRPTVPVTVVRNGIDAASFSRSVNDNVGVRQRFRMPPDAAVIGNVAALIPQKRLHDWIDAARLIYAEHPRTRFLLVGDGQQRGDLLKRIEAAGLSDVLFLCGTQEDVRPFLSAMDIYMMSSAYEGLSVALLEAMAMQCAPVCTAVGGITEVIQDGKNGLLADVGAPGMLAAKVGALLDDRERRLRTADAARRTVADHFRIDRMAREVERVYLDVIGRRESDASVKSQQRVAYARP